MKKLFFLLLIINQMTGCDIRYDSPVNNGKVNAGADEPTPKFYMEQYDPIRDNGQYFHLDMMKNLPAQHFELYALTLANRNSPDVAGGEVSAGGGFGLQHHLLCQSLTGINDRAVSENKVTTGMWMDASNSVVACREARIYAKMGSPSWIVWAGNMLTNRGFLPLDGGVMDVLGRNYVLTDVINNPESGIVAIVASHVYNAIIVDVRDKDFFDENGFSMIYNASEKTTEDSWREFKAYCNNKALVVMPVYTGELADFAIANNLFVINLNKQNSNPVAGQNTELFKEVLNWLEPNSPIYGWETGVGEDEFVNLVSKSGNMMVAIQEFNIPYLSYNYKARQTPVLAKVINPADIDFTKDKKFVSFYLSDGAHAGWMINGFVENYFTDPNVEKVKMGFGITSNVSMIAPLQFEKIINTQKASNSLIESFGGGYYYSDDFGQSKNRTTLLKNLAEIVASHMRQHRIKILEQIAHNPKSDAAKEAYQAFVDANDQLEGIVVIQYAPSYAECGGEILWVTNKEGYDIPVVTVRYSIWNMGSRNASRDGTPAYIANKLNAESADSKFSSVIVHAWSTFTDTGNSTDELAENAAGGNIRGASASEMCARRLNNDCEVVSMQELIWRIRMHYRPEQTEKFINTYF